MCRARCRRASLALRAMTRRVLPFILLLNWKSRLHLVRPVIECGALDGRASPAYLRSLMALRQSLTLPDLIIPFRRLNFRRLQLQQERKLPSLRLPIRNSYRFLRSDGWNLRRHPRRFGLRHTLARSRSHLRWMIMPRWVNPLSVPGRLAHTCPIPQCRLLRP